MKPDLVIVYQGYNDIAAMGFADQRWDHSHFYRDLDIDEVLRHGPRSCLLGILFGAMGRPPIQGLATWTRKPRVDGPDRLAGIEDTLDNLRTIRALAESRGAHALFSTFQFRDTDGEHSAYNKRLRHMFAEEGFDWVDQDALIPDGDATLQVDECHFTDEGNELLTRNFFDAIMKRGWLH